MGFKAPKKEGDRMMIPKVINEVEYFQRKCIDDGSYIKQYVVHAPEWAILTSRLQLGTKTAS